MNDDLSVVLYLITFFIDLLFLYRTYHTEKETFLVKFRTATLPLVLLFVIMWGHIALKDGYTSEDKILILASFFASACISYSLHTWIKQSTHIQSNASFLKATTYIANFIILAYFAFSLSDYHTDEYGPTAFPTIAIIQILLLGLSFFMKWKRGLKPELDEWITLPLIPLVLVIPYAYLSYIFQGLGLIYMDNGCAETEFGLSGLVRFHVDDIVRIRSIDHPNRNALHHLGCCPYLNQSIHLKEKETWTSTK